MRPNINIRCVGRFIRLKIATSRETFAPSKQAEDHLKFEVSMTQGPALHRETSWRT